MNTSVDVTGDLLKVYGNSDGLYQGDLWHYFKVLNEAPSANNPFHNTRHGLHVTWNCYLAAKYYADQLSQRRIRNLLIGGTLHDYGHSGTATVPDERNIAIAQAGLHTNILPEDRLELPRITGIIGATLYTKDGHAEATCLEEEIIQDSDVTQALHPAWYSLICEGLAKEFGITKVVMLERQLVFLDKLDFNTTWAKERFPQSAIDAKKRETEGLLNGMKSVNMT